MKEKRKHVLPFALMALAIAPWAWAVPVVPAWVSLVSAAIAVTGIALVIGYWRPEADACSRDHSLFRFLHRWSGIAQETQGNVQSVRTQIHGVMEQTEQAIVNIADGFRSIKDKTSAQMEHMEGLLRNARVGAEQTKAEEMAALARSIDTLGEEVKREVYRIIVELQFHDVTHQRLDRIKNLLLTELDEGLHTIARETQGVKEVMRNGGPMPAPPASAPGQREPRPPAKGNEVELF